MVLGNPPGTNTKIRIRRPTNKHRQGKLRCLPGTILITDLQPYHGCPPLVPRLCAIATPPGTMDPRVWKLVFSMNDLIAGLVEKSHSAAHLPAQHVLVSAVRRQK